MSASRLSIALFFAAASCGPPAPTTSEGKASLSLRLNKRVLHADGSEQATLEISGADKDGKAITAGALTLTLVSSPVVNLAQDPATVSIEAPATKAVVKLKACSLAGDPKCLGTVKIQAKHGDTGAEGETSLEVVPPSESLCDDAQDEDRDNLADCADPDCRGQTCAYEMKCNESSQCARPPTATGGGAVANPKPTLVVTALTPRVAALADRSVLVTAELKDQNGEPLGDETVTFTTTFSLLATTPGGTGAASLDQPTNGEGRAAVYLIAGTSPGRAQVTARAKVGDIEASHTIVIEIVKFGLITFDRSDFRVMGVKTSGYREQNVLHFSLLDDKGNPYLEEVTVTFSHRKIGSGTDSTRIDPGDNTSVKVLNGDATVTLYSGTAAGTVTLVAAASDGATVSNTTSPSIAIIGAKANGKNMAFFCEKGKHNIAAIIAHDCTYAGEPGLDVDCTVIMGDRFNNQFGREARVYFTSEAGLFGPPAFTAEIDPDRQPSEQDLGKATGVLHPDGGRLPKDVPPLDPSDCETQEPCLQRTTLCDGQTPRTYNPRDGLVTLVAATEGEEGFFDQNANGKFDAGEAFIDLAEPFVDKNDDGTHQSDEEFIDTDNDGQWDDANGDWDANTTIWQVQYLLYTGGPAYGVESTGTPPHADFHIGLDTTADIVSIAKDATTGVFAHFRDINLNRLSPETTTTWLSSDTTVVSATRSPDFAYLDGFGFDLARPTTCTTSAGKTICKQSTVFGNFGSHGLGDSAILKGVDTGVASVSLYVNLRGRIYGAPETVAVTVTPAP